MQLADRTIDQSQQQAQQLVRTYVNTFDLEGASVTSVSQFESECLVLLEDGWRLKQASHRGSIVSPHTIVAAFEKELNID